MNSKKFLITTFAMTIIILCCVAIPIIIVDPFFHYHKPLEGYNYNVYNQRYANDGIISNFDYDAMIIGTSMTENFRTSDMDAWFGVSSIKVPLAGATFKEINQHVEKGTKENQNLKIVVRGLDFVNFTSDKDAMSYDAEMYPTYLYDENIFNDVKYFLDKEVLTQSVIQDVFLHTINGGEHINFDTYSMWWDGHTFSKETALKSYSRPEIISEMQPFDEIIRERVYGNTMQNMIAVAEANPDITFYYYITPYSILFFDREYREGRLLKNINAAEYSAELMLEYPNIKLYSFFDLYDIICNLDNYKDLIHHSDSINVRILKWMNNDTGLLTKDNYKQHFEDIRQFYLTYDYDSIFQ